MRASLEAGEDSAVNFLLEVPHDLLPRLGCLLDAPSVENQTRPRPPQGLVRGCRDDIGILKRAGNQLAEGRGRGEGRRGGGGGGEEGSEREYIGGGGKGRGKEGGRGKGKGEGDGGVREGMRERGNRGRGKGKGGRGGGSEAGGRCWLTLAATRPLMCAMSAMR